MDEKMFRSILLLSADSPEQLRPCDVDRVMEAALDKGIDLQFKVWLLTFRDSMNERTIQNIENWEI